MSRLVGRYRLIERLGAGGMSVVWRAYDEVLGRPVAVKMLNGRYAADAASRTLIRAEARSAGRLSHPNVTNVYDYGEALETDGNRVPFVVMELVDGVTLDAHLERGPLPRMAAVRIAAEVAAALAAAHAHGLVHRDIKPTNVMLTATGVKVVDFGIAAVAGAPADNSPTVLGTPAYLAPERLLGSAVTPASDVYALGLLLYRTLTGRLPWLADTVTQMINAHRYVEPAALPPIPDLPAEIGQLCDHCLAKSADDRPSAAEAAATLAAAAGIRVPLPLGEVLDWAGDGAGTVAVAGGESTIRTEPPATGYDAAGYDAAGPRRRRSRVAAIALGSAVAVTAAGLATGAWSKFDGSASGGHGQPPAAAAERLQMGGTGTPCEVRYRTKSDVAGAFAVDVTIVNGNGRALPAWTLRFDFAGDQAVTGGTGAQWSQSGSSVTTRGTAPLAPGATTTASFTGGYREGNPLPTAFTLNGMSCRAAVTGATGEPAQPAQPPPAGQPAQPAQQVASDQGNAPANGGNNESNNGKGKGKGKG
jgi:eukaryotic-like serine/threonine-protein kinase